MGQLQSFVYRDVEQGAVIVDTEAAEDRRLVLGIQGIREAQPGLDGAVERLPLAAGADVLAQIERGRERVVIPGQRVHHVLRRHVVGIEHLGLEIPAHAQVKRQPRRRAPVVLEIEPDLGVLLVEGRIPVP
jgi:hypothetical protein